MITNKREAIGSLMPLPGTNPTEVPSIKVEFVRWAELSDDLDIVMKHGIDSHGRVTVIAHDADGDGMDTPKTVVFLVSKGVAECVSWMLGALAEVLPSSDDEFDRGSNPVTKQQILRDAGDLLGLDPDQDGVHREYQRGCVDLVANVCNYEHEDVCAMLGLDYRALYPGVRIIEDVPLPGDQVEDDDEGEETLVDGHDDEESE